PAARRAPPCCARSGPWATGGPVGPRRRNWRTRERSRRSSSDIATSATIAERGPDRMNMAEARAALGATRSALRAIYDELRSIEQSVPPSPRETSEKDWQEDLGGQDELRAVLGTVLHDCFTPMLDDLETLTQAPPAASAPSAPEPRLAETAVCRKLDLAAEEREMLPVVHALVVKDNFTVRP